MEKNLETIVKVDGSIVSELSERIPSNIVALNELIKNSYDAGSPEVEIVIDSKLNILKIADKGEGMSKNDIDTLFHISKSTKKFGQFNDKYKRYVQGSKGLGFLSVFKFGHKVEWKTKKDLGYRFLVDFDELSKIDNLSEFKVHLIRDDSIENGTEITIQLNDDSKQLLLGYLSEEKNYAKIINSFTDDNFLITLQIDEKKYKSSNFQGLKNHFTERQLYYVEYDSKDGRINFYHNNCLTHTANLPFTYKEFSVNARLSIYSFKSNQKSNIYKLFYDYNDNLTPLIYINNNLFNNFEMFDPSIMKTIKYSYNLQQMIGFVNIYSNNDQIQFNSDRTKFAQNLLTDEIIKFLKNLNIRIQEEGAKKKNFLLDYDFLKCKKVEIAKVDFKDINRLRDFINDGFEFKDKVSINVRDNKIVYEVFGKETYIEIIKSTPKVVPADITLKTKSEIMFIPTKQIDLRDYIVKATDSNGNNIREKVKICVDGVEKYIIDSQEEEKIIIVEYSYNDLYTKLIKQNLQLIFKAQHIALTGTFNDENKLLYVRTAKNYSICFDNTISSLINQINKLTLAENREVISCCIRVLFELSVKCLIHSSKNITIKSSLRNGKIHDQIETIISFCQQQTIKEKIAKRTEFEFHTLDNTLFKEDFINAYKKSNLGPHSATSYLTDNDIIDISKKAAFFLLLINEIITNPNIM